ncbi:universal stress protein [Aromatoleum toluolicum]|uniref:Universal stress protein n=1 Tax=Aromatoleum toluolicum TaxID=90060 RepID=A0ABX1NHR2_9RHOO|nr:universal stress protein [Aromatoleum toluolicum]NMF98831.1 universal stress protein [Aromatoleum toluolicum]
MYQHLFVPVDGSELSHRAMDGSIALAKQLGARITGFVVEPDVPLSATSRNPETFARHLREHEQKNESHSNALLGQFRERAEAVGVAFSGLAVTAYMVDNAIMEEAERAGCDMIVMVTHGRGPIGEFLFGSHTQKIVARSRLPVLVLH